MLKICCENYWLLEMRQCMSQCYFRMSTARIPVPDDMSLTGDLKFFHQQLLFILPPERAVKVIAIFAIFIRLIILALFVAILPLTTCTYKTQEENDHESQRSEDTS